MKHINIAIIGAPNVGKSTFLNSFLGQKISIVTHKKQTTRNIIPGIKIIDNIQFIFSDTPGIFSAKRGVDKFIIKTALLSIKNADIVLLILDVYKEIDEKIKEILTNLLKQKKKFVIAINKCDDLENQAVKDKFNQLTSEINELQRSINQFSMQNDTKTASDDTKMECDAIMSPSTIPGLEIFPISALYNDFQNLIDHLKKYAIKDDFLYSEDEITTLPLRFLAEEITREKILLNIHDEIPYNLIIETEKFEEKNEEMKIWQVIKVISESHKKIILGSNGNKIKRIGQQSRMELEKIFGMKFHLFLHIKIRSNFMDKSNVFDIKTF